MHATAPALFAKLHVLNRSPRTASCERWHLDRAMDVRTGGRARVSCRPGTMLFPWLPDEQERVGRNGTALCRSRARNYLPSSVVPGVGDEVPWVRRQARLGLRAPRLPPVVASPVAQGT